MSQALSFRTRKGPPKHRTVLPGGFILKMIIQGESRTCFKCGKRGHLQANCPGAGNDSKGSGKSRGKGQSKSKGKPKNSRAAELTDD